MIKKKKNRFSSKRKSDLRENIKFDKSKKVKTPEKPNETYIKKT